MRAAADDYFAGGASKSLAEIDPSLGTGASAALGDYVEATTRTAFLTDEGLVAGASLSDIDMSTMGARADPGATGAFLFTALLFGGLRWKVSGAVRAKEDRLRQELAY